MKDEPVIGSKRVFHTVSERYEVRIPKGSSDEVKESYKQSLINYANAIGYAGDPILEEVEDGVTVYYLEGEYSSSGLNYNDMVYSNITWID